MENKNLTVEGILAHHPCREGLEYARKFNTIADAWDSCERADWMLWLLRERKLIDKKTSVRIAIRCAERVLPIYEENNPGNSAPRKALEAAAKWLEIPTEENRRAAYAYADDVSYSDAADNDDYAYFVYSAAGYAAAAAYSTDDDDDDERKVQANIIREIIGNPFR